MTEVAFHFNATDKVAYACRLLRKAVGSGAKLVVTAGAADLQALDVALWTFAPLEFVPHCTARASAAVLAASPVMLADPLSSYTSGTTVAVTGGKPFI